MKLGIILFDSMESLGNTGVMRFPAARGCRGLACADVTGSVPASGGLLISMVCMAIMLAPVTHSTYFRIYQGSEVKLD